MYGMGSLERMCMERDCSSGCVWIRNTRQFIQGYAWEKNTRLDVYEGSRGCVQNTRVYVYEIGAHELVCRTSNTYKEKYGRGTVPRADRFGTVSIIWIYGTGTITRTYLEQ